MRMTEGEYKARQGTASAAPGESAKKRFQALGRKKPGEMNKTEQQYAEHLEARKASGEVLWFAFEAVTLKIAKDCRLTVDFFVMLSSGELQAHDVKGSKAIVQDDFKVKAKVAASMFPWPFFCAYPTPKKDGGGWNIEEIG